MPTSFTSWSDLHAAMLNALADFIATGKFTKVQYRIETSTNQRELSYRSLAEFKLALEWVKTMADLETGVAVRRSLAKPVGRFPT